MAAELIPMPTVGEPHHMALLRCGHYTWALRGETSWYTPRYCPRCSLYRDVDRWWDLG